MSEFVLLDFDYEPYLNTPEQTQMFERMCKLFKHLNEPIAQCWQQVEEFENLHRRIIGNKSLIKLQPFDGTKINGKPESN